MLNWDDDMKKVGKDSFIPGFVPHHNHGSVDYTAVADGHVHQCLDVHLHRFKLKMEVIFIILKVMLFMKMDMSIIIKPIRALPFQLEMVCMCTTMTFIRQKTMDIDTT